MIRMPRTPVIRPPMRKLIRFGHAFEKSYDGLTMLAATLTDRVATASVNTANTTTIGLSNLPTSATGSQIGAPNTTVLADVTSTAISGKTVMVVGRPSAWPIACSRWLRPKRVKSGMLSERVDQNAIMPISAGGKTLIQKSVPQPRVPWSSTSGPKPPAEIVIQMSRKTATIRTNGAAQFSNRRIASMPRRMIAMLKAQNTMKLSHSVHG